MVNNPLVSVCVPTYNDSNYLKKSLESIINQTYKDLEIIVCDNASTDNTKEIVDSFKDERIKYYKSSKTTSCITNWNFGLKMAKGECIAIYHSDDIYEPQIIEKEVNFLLSNLRVGAVFSLDKLINEKDIFIGNGVELPKNIGNSAILDFSVLFQELLYKSGSFLVTPTFMTKRNVIDNVGLFDETLKYGDSDGSGSDMALWLKIAEKYSIGILKERLIRRRISRSRGTYRYESTRISRANHFVILDEYLNSSLEAKNIQLKKSVLGQYEFNKFWDDVKISFNLIKQRKQNEARSLLLKSFSWHKLLSSPKTIKNLSKSFMFGFLLLFTLFNVKKQINALNLWLM
ncbi:MAG: glycosyltransferase family 2 protein [Candidatus Omnitrophica bacterium]|nr:glycosyltransferase family 2 protein [Candidatus Omnitrophota bacterium]